MMKSDTSFVCSVTVFDKFWELGLTGVSICKKKTENSWFIDSFLLSCRIFSRDIELQFFYEMLDMLPRSVEKLYTEYIATPKNAQVESFWEKVGFDCVKKEDVRKEYIGDVSKLRKTKIDWINVERDVWKW